MSISVWIEHKICETLIKDGLGLPFKEPWTSMKLDFIEEGKSLDVKKKTQTNLILSSILAHVVEAE